MNYICQMCIKLAYITIYFGLHLQYIIHICDVLLLLVLSLARVRACLPSFFFLYAKKTFLQFSIFTFQNCSGSLPPKLAKFPVLDAAKFSILIFNFFIIMALEKAPFREKKPSRSARITAIFFFLFFFFPVG